MVGRHLSSHLRSLSIAACNFTVVSQYFKTRHGSGSLCVKAARFQGTEIVKGKSGVRKYQGQKEKKAGRFCSLVKMLGAVGSNISIYFILLYRGI